MTLSEYHGWIKDELARANNIEFLVHDQHRQSPGFLQTFKLVRSAEFPTPGIMMYYPQGLWISTWILGAVDTEKLWSRLIAEGGESYMFLDEECLWFDVAGEFND